MTPPGRVPRPLRGIVTALMVAGAFIGTASGEDLLLGEEAAAAIAVEGERRLIVDGIHGEILVRGEPTDELRFVSSDPAGDDVRIPVALWSDQTSFRITPTTGTEGRARKLEIGIPAEMYLRIFTTDGTVRIAAVDGDVEVEGRTLLVVARELGSGLEVQMEEGDLHVEGVAADVTLRGTIGEADIRQVGGLLIGELHGGRASLAKLGGGADLHLQDCNAFISSVSSELRLEAIGGEVEIEGLRSGGRIKLMGTPIGVSDSEGNIEIESDAMVRFHDNAAAIRVINFAAAVRGATNGGPVSVEAHGGSVNLENIVGTVRVEGDDLEVSLEDIKGDLAIHATSSSVEIARAEGPVTVENEFGDVTVTGSEGKVTVVSREGDVRLSELRGPIDVDADGPVVEVAWKSLGVEGDSVIQNEGGDVVVRFPARAGCVIDASSGFGRIESNLPGVAVSDDGGRASGMLNRRGRPRVKVRSDGSLRLTVEPKRREKEDEGENGPRRPQ